VTALRPWKVYLGVPTGRTIDFGVWRSRSYATEELARAAAARLVLPDAEGSSFVATRVGAPLSAGWGIGVVVEYEAVSDGVVVRVRRDLLAEVRGV
jgi:hypothetical protein